MSELNPAMQLANDCRHVKLTVFCAKVAGLRTSNLLIFSEIKFERIQWKNKNRL